MKNNIVITEEDLRNIIRESVERVIRENQEEEGFWDNMKSAFRGAKQGYDSQKHLDSNVETDYSRNTRMSPNEMPDNDAAETVKKLYDMASEYHIKANQLRNRAKAIAKQYGVNVSNGVKGRKDRLSNKIVNYDLSTEFNGKRPSARQQHANYTTKASIKGNQPQNSAWKVQP